MSEQNAGEERADALEEFDARLNAFSTQIENLREELREERKRRRDLERELEKRDARIDELEKEVNRLDARTDLLSLVDKADQMDAKQRSVALIQHLKRAAEKQRERGEPAKSSVNRDEAESALQYPDVDRTTIYTDMERAERLVGDKDVLRYESGSGGGSRLKLNLEAGNLPREIVGQQQNGGSQ